MDPWIVRGEASTSVLVYGEVTEHLLGLPNGDILHERLMPLLIAIRPWGLDERTMRRYAEVRRRMRRPFGEGLIGDIDTLIAASALEYGMILVTADSDFQRVPGFDVMLVPRKM